MSNVVTLPPRDDDELVWRCDCGCTTHFAHASGKLECANCGAAGNGESGGWRRNLPEPALPVAEIGPGDHKVTQIGSPENALRRLLKKVSAETASAVIIVNSDGSLSTWDCGLQSDEHKEWLRAKMAAAERLMLQTPE